MRKNVQKFAKRILCFLLTLCIGSSTCIALAVSKETQDKIDQVEREKNEAEEQKKEAEQEKDKLHNAKADMESYLSNLNQQSKSLNEQISILTSDIESKEAEVAAKEEEIDQAQADLDKQYEDMKKRIQYMYENSQDTMMTYLTAALTNGISDMLNQVEYASNISKYDRDMLENYKSSKADLETRYAELQDEQEALELLKGETEKKKEQVATQQKAAGSKISEYNDLISRMAGELSSMEELIAEKTKILNQLIAKAEEEERQAKIQAAQAAAASTGGSITAGDSKISHHSIGLSDYELMLLATIIYCEAGNQGLEGQLAVGYVVMNRVRSGLFPNTLEGVLRQSRQFEPVGSGRFDLVLQAEQDDDIPNIVTQSCWTAASTVVNGTSNVGDSLFFRTWAPVPQLIKNLENGGVPYWIIKDHVFYYYWTSYSQSEPDESDEPDEKEEPEDTDEPDREEEPEESEEPDENEVPEDSDAPDESEESDESEELDESNEPEESEEPDESDEPEESEEPDMSDESEESEEPEISDEAEEL